MADGAFEYARVSGFDVAVTHLKRLLLGRLAAFTRAQDLLFEVLLVAELGSPSPRR
jgi:hypothetical protein